MTAAAVDGAPSGSGGPDELADGSDAATLRVHVGDGDNDCRAAAEFGCRFIGIALPPARGGNGKPNGGFSAPFDAVAIDMVEAAPRLCSLLGIPPPPCRWLPCRGCVAPGLPAVGAHIVAHMPPTPANRTQAPHNTAPPGARGKQSFMLRGQWNAHRCAVTLCGGRAIVGG